MFCTNCGKEIVDNAKFCSFCGLPVQNVIVRAPVAAPIQPAPMPEPVPAPVTEQPAPVFEEPVTEAAAPEIPVETPAEAPTQAQAEAPVPEPAPAPVFEQAANIPEPNTAVFPENLIPQPNNIPASGGSVSQNTAVPEPVKALPEPRPERRYTLGHIMICLGAAAVMAITAGVFAGLYFSVI